MRVRSLFVSVVLGVLAGVNPVMHRVATAAELFGIRALDRDDVVAIAVPIDKGEAYNLLIVEQLSSSRDCWREQGDGPTVIDPLLLNFDFTNICNRSTDSNGYSLRLAGEDMSWRYTFKVVRAGNELKLQALNAENPWRSPIEVGSTKGFANGFLKIHLNEGWQMGKRTYEGKTLGHIYLVNELSANRLVSEETAQIASNTSRPVTAPTRSVNVAPASQNSSSSEPIQIFVPPSAPLATGVTKTPIPAAPSTVGVPSLTSKVPDLSVVPVPGTSIPSNASGLVRLNASGAQQAPPPPISLAQSLGLRYKVVVNATTESQKASLKSVVPDAFNTWVGDRRMMQAGAFADEIEAQELQTRLQQIGLSSQIISIR
ncbi:MAG: DUF3747 domain-containing protein [Limnothrix sp.]